ncbi:response regulator [Paraburkholderia sp. C35]|uniref:response regulator transcription factor n=1 Tax=Paraburkholderia sp. C35 TaxID=2126993 RepID=UPI000D68DEF5|nr:response regulator [Paraburkholderia sp. C35]
MSTLYADTRNVTLSRATIPSPMVFIVDDDISVRESVESLLRHEGFAVESFVTASAFLEHPVTSGPSCILLDITLPGVTGLELQKSLAVERQAMPIIFITGREDAPTIVQAMKAGAVEFLTKPFRDDALLDAIRAAIERSEGLVLRERRKTAIRERYGDLTRREREVLSLITQGLLNREIGDELGISEITVKAHRGQVMRKMEAESLAELIHMVGDGEI